MEHRIPPQRSQMMIYRPTRVAFRSQHDRQVVDDLRLKGKEVVDRFYATKQLGMSDLDAPPQG